VESKSKPETLEPSAAGDERGQVIAALGHDIRGPLQVLGLSLQGLRLRARESEDRELVLTAESACDEISAITDDLIDSLRLEVSDEPPRAERIALSNLFYEIENQFRGRAVQQNLRLRVFAPRIHCTSDRRYLRRILGNLVANALKHSHGKRILAGAKLRGYETLILEVLDDGLGIPEDEQPLIFNEGYRGRAAVAANTRGQGLGLWIVQRFVEAAGGRVTVWSREGYGTRFTVQLPTHAARCPLPAVRFDSTGRTLDRTLVALLSDEDALRATRVYLEGFGINVFASDDDLHFLAHVMTMPVMPDLFLLDFGLGATPVERTLRTLQTRFGTRLRAVVVSRRNPHPRLRAIEREVPVIAMPLTTAHMEDIVAMLAPAARLDGNKPLAGNAEICR
jgi:two-component sensor histidine kinase